ncbi:hypothetical protein B0H12DRAFT_1074087 [Mycena haematopus]|nr:hypothetical protein B0H12DRAFT_1074087 [Mycena haematopus]
MEGGGFADLIIVHIVGRVSIVVSAADTVASVRGLTSRVSPQCSHATRRRMGTLGCGTGLNVRASCLRALASPSPPVGCITGPAINSFGASKLVLLPRPSNASMALELNSSEGLRRRTPLGMTSVSSTESADETDKVPEVGWGWVGTGMLQRWDGDRGAVGADAAWAGVDVPRAVEARSRSRCRFGSTRTVPARCEGSALGGRDDAVVLTAQAWPMSLAVEGRGAMGDAVRYRTRALRGERRGGWGWDSVNTTRGYEEQVARVLQCRPCHGREVQALCGMVAEVHRQQPSGVGDRIDIVHAVFAQTSSKGWDRTLALPARYAERLVLQPDDCCYRLCEQGLDLLQWTSNLHLRVAHPRALRDASHAEEI